MITHKFAGTEVAIEEDDGKVVVTIYKNEKPKQYKFIQAYTFAEAYTMMKAGKKMKSMVTGNCGCGGFYDCVLTESEIDGMWVEANP